MKKLLLLLLIFAVAAGAYYKDLVVGETAGDQVVINRAGTLDIGVNATHFNLDVGDNALQLYIDSDANAGGAYDDGIQDYIYGNSGDGAGGVRAIKAIGFLTDGGWYSEVYGCDILAMQNNGTPGGAPVNLYNVLMSDVADTDAGDCPTGFVGTFGILGNSGGATYTPEIKSGIVGCIQDEAGNAADGVTSMLNGDSGAAPNNPMTAWYGIYNRRSTATDIHAYGIDFVSPGSLVPECRVADIHGQNGEMISNLVDTAWTFTGAITPAEAAAVVDDVTPSVEGINVLVTPDNTGPTACTDLTEPVLWAQYNIICGGTATNPLTIADGGAVFLLTGNWVPDSVGDNITLRCIQVAGAHVFVEVARSNN